MGQNATPRGRGKWAFQRRPEAVAGLHFFVASIMWMLFGLWTTVAMSPGDASWMQPLTLVAAVAFTCSAVFFVALAIRNRHVAG